MQQTDSGRIIGKIGLNLIDSSKKARKSFIEQGEEVMKYYSAPNYGFEYQTLPQDTFFKAKVALTFQAVALFIQNIAPALPHRQPVFERNISPLSKLRYDVVSEYLNASIKKTPFKKYMRRLYLDLIGFGRGVAFTGVHPQTGMVTTIWQSIRNYHEDPDSLISDEKHWQGLDRVLPRYVVKKMYPQAAELIDKLNPSALRRTDAEGDGDGGDTSCECVRFFEVWCDSGIHNYKGGNELMQALRREKTPTGEPAMPTDNRPMKLVFADDGALIHAGPWEVPWYKGNFWPGETVEVYEDDTGSWPIGPLQAGLGYQKAINWLVTLAMGKFRHTARMQLAFKRQNGQGLSEKAIERVMIGPDIEALEVDIKGENKSMKDFLEYFQGDMNWLQPTLLWMDALERKHAEATGLYSILHSGEGATQDRSAASTQMKDRNSRQRLEDMREQVLNFHARIGRKEAIALQFLKDREHVGQMIGPDASEAFGFLAQPEQKDPNYWMERLMQAGVMPQEAAPLAQMQASQAFTVDDIFTEVDFTIEAGSQLRRDINQQIDVLREQMNQNVATMLQSPDPMERALAYDAMAAYYEIVGLPQEFVDKYKAQAELLRQQAQLMMAAPVPAGAPAEEGAPV